MTPEQEKIVESLSGLAAYEVEQLVDHIVSTREIYGPQDYEQLQEDFDRLLDENVHLEREVEDLRDEIREYETELSHCRARITDLEDLVSQLRGAT